jgi:MoaA/NifB/PqqE/SkfB family radical SAM enzyme
MKKFIRFLNKKLFWFIYRFKPLYMFPFPNFVCIEASTYCNLKCVCCPTGQGKKGMSKGFLKFKDFKKFVDKYNHFIERIQLSNYGEPFLNTKIFKIIKYAENKGIKTSADTNLNYFNESMAEKLIKSGMSELTISIDGVTNESYSKYRVNGDLNKVISNIKRINKFKRKYNSDKPKLNWQFIVFSHNEHEINRAKGMAEKLNMHFYIKRGLNFGQNFSLPSQKYRINTSYILEKYCYQLWHLPTINYNGNLLGCCILFDEKYHFGNIFKEGFFYVYNNKKMRAARRIILKKLKKANISSIYCSKCWVSKKFL